MSKSSNSSRGIGRIGLLTILFIVLKLTGHITWSWIWVLAPLWISSAVGLTFLGICVGIVTIIAYKDERDINLITTWRTNDRERTSTHSKKDL